MASGTLLEALLAEVSGGGDVDPLASAATLERVVKAEKRPAPLKRLLEWAQKWLFDLHLAAGVFATALFPAPGGTAAGTRERNRQPQDLGIQPNGATIQGPV